MSSFSLPIPPDSQLGIQQGSFALFEHQHPSYPPRTRLNAQMADLTCAIAADLSTAGERLTAQMAADRYLPLPLFLEPEEAAERLSKMMRDRRARSLNVAGNGMHTLHQKGWSQDRLDDWVLSAIRQAHAAFPIAWIHSGGQTGADSSGAVAALALGIPGRSLFPKGYRQRSEKGFDFSGDPAALMASWIERSVASCRRLGIAQVSPGIDSSAPRLSR